MRSVTMAPLQEKRPVTAAAAAGNDSKSGRRRERQATAVTVDGGRSRRQLQRRWQARPEHKTPAVVANGCGSGSGEQPQQG